MSTPGMLRCRVGDRGSLIRRRRVCMRCILIGLVRLGFMRLMGTLRLGGVDDGKTKTSIGGDVRDSRCCVNFIRLRFRGL